MRGQRWLMRSMSQAHRMPDAGGRPCLPLPHLQPGLEVLVAHRLKLVLCEECGAAHARKSASLLDGRC